MSELLIVCVTAGVVLGSVFVGALSAWFVMRTRGKTDHVTVLCHLLNRTVNAALTERDDQLSRILAEEKTNEAIASAHEPPPGRLPLSPAYSPKPAGRGEMRVGTMP